MATTEGTVVTLNHSINPLHAVMFPGLSSWHVSTTLGKYRLFGFQSKLDRPVRFDFVIIAARDVSAAGYIGPGGARVNEEVPRRFHYI
jgi:hypothetical protein